LLPILEKKDEIISLLKKEQVIIICGETGSGKTTQLPQICLELGFGEKGKIVITQPRRIAATSISQRIANETKTTLGSLVGYEIRFSKKLSKDTKILCMTDGILLAQLAQNPKLLGYSAIIIDEAHERSLNIDLTLGYLRKILPKRRDLRIIISSATMDTSLFSKAFDDAPVLNVSGRMFPVEIIYDDIENSESYIDRAIKAVENIIKISDSGDVLVFMPAERDILETTRKLKGRFLQDSTEILPLFSRLSNAEQNRIFADTDARKIIVSTNIAETSITLAKIKFVVDTGLVRIAKYVPNLRTNRLPIEETSKAEATQRCGRSGRVSDGICIRLYSKKNFDGREDFRTPEIQRLNLAGVILQTLNLNLGDIKNFPFIQPPQPQRIDDAINQLYELGAIYGKQSESLQLTQIGKIMAKFPLEPHVSRMIIQAQKEGVSKQVAIIAAGLSIIDPRERPVEKELAADNAHQKFIDIYSDFMSLLKMWSVFHNSFDELRKSQKAMRDYCSQHFLSFNRMREWGDIYEQISTTCKEYDKNFDKVKIDFENLSETNRWAIHKSICAGLVANVAVFDGEKNAYLATKNRTCYIFPGSALAGGKRRKSQWIMAQQITETSRVFARTLGPIDPKWIIEFVPDLLKRKYGVAFYDEKTASVVCEETILFYGLEISGGQKRFYGNINLKAAREIFIQSALVERNMSAEFPFFQKNFVLIEKLKEIEIQRRIVGQMFSREALFEFYDKKIPENISSDRQLSGWIKHEKEKNINEFLTVSESEIVPPIFAGIKDEYPDSFGVGNTRFELSYRCNFGQDDDGITVTVYENELIFIRDDVFDWLITPLLPQKIEELIRTLPKAERKNFIPVETNAKRIFEEMKKNHKELTVLQNKIFSPPQISFLQALCQTIQVLFGKNYDNKIFNVEEIPDFLKMRIAVVAKDKSVIGFTKNLKKDRNLLLKNAESGNSGGKLGNLLQQKTIKNHQKIVENYVEFIKNVDLDTEIIKNCETDFGYPALNAEQNGVDIVWFASPETADRRNPFGLAKLLEFSLNEDFGWLEKNLRLPQNIKLMAKAYGGGDFVSKRLFEIVRDAVCFPIINVKSWREFDEVRKQRLEILRKSEKSVVNDFIKFANSASKVRQYLDVTIAKTPKHKILQNIKTELEIYIEQFVSGYCPLVIFERYSFYIDALICKIDKCLNSPKHYEECEKTISFYQEKSVEFVEKIHEKPVEFETFAERFCFLVEELSLKLFAEPKIKPIESVSIKKLEKFFEENGKI
jgi:ATP-dependent helicase HrpA